MLALPASATVTYARLYWSAKNGATADNTAVIDRGVVNPGELFNHVDARRERSEHIHVMT